MIKECENIRINWMSTKLELKDSKKRIEVLNWTLDQMKADLKILNKKKTNFRNQSNRLRERMYSIKNFIINSKNFCQCDRKKKKLLSLFDNNVIKEELESDSDNYSSLEDFRSSEEYLLKMFYIFLIIFDFRLNEMNENYSDLKSLFDDFDMSD